MLQKELAKRLRARYDTKIDGNRWLEVSSDGIRQNLRTSKKRYQTTVKKWGTYNLWEMPTNQRAIFGIR